MVTPTQPILFGIKAHPNGMARLSPETVLIAQALSIGKYCELSEIMVCPPKKNEQRP